jgi:pimeloyl-ACP methyl ester carboxylesterase
VAWQVAGRYPERVRTLTAVSVPHPKALTAAMQSGQSDQAERSGYMQWIRQAAPGEVEDTMLADGAARLRTMLHGLEPSAVEEYVALLSEPGALTAALNWYRASSREDVLGIGAVTAPTLFVWSDHDVAIGADAARACGEHVEGPYRFEAIEGVDHWVPEKAAERLNALLAEHLA